MALRDDFKALQDAVEIFQNAVSSARALAADYHQPSKPIDDAVQALVDIETLGDDPLSPSAATAAEAAEMGDFDECRKQLSTIHAVLLDIGETHEERVSTWDVGAALYRVQRQRSEEAKAWVQSAQQGLDDVIAPFDRVQRAVYVCWTGLAELLSHPSAKPEAAYTAPYPPAEDTISPPTFPLGPPAFLSAGDTVFDIVDEGLQNTADSIVAAFLEFDRSEEVRGRLGIPIEQIATQQYYSKTAATIPEFDTETFARQLRSFLSAVASQLDGTLAFAQDGLAKLTPPPENPEAMLAKIDYARDTAWQAAEDIADYRYGGMP